MPKVAPSSKKSFVDSDIEATESGVTVLKRNQACHQCRRRKLKCDAKRPCGTCVRSHKNAIKHAGPGTETPSLQCTYDETADTEELGTASPASHPAKNRYEKLESRINELESMLNSRGEIGSFTDSYIKESSFDDGLIARVSNGRNDNYDSRIQTDSAYTPFLNVLEAPGYDFSNEGARLELASTFSGENSISPMSSPSSYKLVSSDWPDKLPPPDLLRHLAEVFVNYHPSARRLLHGPTLLSSLTLPPTHPKFPHNVLLHAICAIATFYTVAVPPEPKQNFDRSSADAIFDHAETKRGSMSDSFGQKHARLAREGIEQCLHDGFALLEGVQATIILSWYYHQHARWVDVYMLIGTSLRMCVPLGLNVSPPFHSMYSSIREFSLLPQSENFTEEEMRRNVFWLVYIMERSNSAANGWAMSLEDQDVAQLLPVRGEDFENNRFVPSELRQWAQDTDLLTNHIMGQTDSFVLLVKSAMLLSKVKVFNTRFKSRYLSTNGPNLLHQLQDLDVRNNDEFKEIDNLIDIFSKSFPKGLRNPIIGNTVDPHLLTACIIPHVANILLHDPHADVTKHCACLSSQKIFTAARALLEYIYAIWSTSYDMVLLDSFCSFAWFLAGKVLIRFAQAARESDEEAQLMAFKTDLEFIGITLTTVGERIPVANRYAKMLDEIIHKAFANSSSYENLFLQD